MKITVNTGKLIKHLIVENTTDNKVKINLNVEGLIEKVDLIGFPSDDNSQKQQHCEILIEHLSQEVLKAISLALQNCELSCDKLLQQDNIQHKEHH
jgi:hypothetical protein